MTHTESKDMGEPKRCPIDTALAICVVRRVVSSSPVPSGVEIWLTTVFTGISRSLDLRTGLLSFRLDVFFISCPP